MDYQDPIAILEEDDSMPLPMCAKVLAAIITIMAVVISIYTRNVISLFMVGLVVILVWYCYKYPRTSLITVHNHGDAWHV